MTSQEVGNRFLTLNELSDSYYGEMDTCIWFSRRTDSNHVIKGCRL